VNVITTGIYVEQEIDYCCVLRSVGNVMQEICSYVPGCFIAD